MFSLPLSLAVLSVVCSGQSVTVMRTTQVQRLVSTDAKPGSQSVSLREVKIQGSLASGHRVDGDLMVIFDPVSHLSWWSFWNSDVTAEGRLATIDWFASHARIHIGAGAVVVFWSRSPGVLQVVERKNLNSSSIEEAESFALRQIELLGQSKATSWPNLGGITVPLALPREFWIPPGFAGSREGTTTVEAVSNRDGSWIIALRDRWEQEVTLNSSYQLVATRQLGPSR